MTFRDGSLITIHQHLQSTSSSSYLLLPSGKADFTLRRTLNFFEEVHMEALFSAWEQENSQDGDREKVKVVGIANVSRFVVDGVVVDGVGNIAAGIVVGDLLLGD